MKNPFFMCKDCENTYSLDEFYRCPKCNGELAIVYDYKSIAREGNFRCIWKQSHGMWDRFGLLLPIY